MKKTSARYSQLVMPNDLNTIGTLFGGQMVSWMDIAAAKAAQRFLCDSHAVGGVTKAIDKVVFSEPVFNGEWVNFDAVVISTGVTSFVVEVSASAEDFTGERRPVCSALFTIVAVTKDKEGKWRKINHGETL